jgi:hypothetical protein
MTRGYRPVIAIGEAKKKAQALGLLVFTLEPGDSLPFHFVICNRECVSLVRVRRLKYPGHDVATIEHSCRNEIEILRVLPVTQEIFRDLWVRGPDREWYRYLVLPGSVELLENRDETDTD